MEGDTDAAKDAAIADYVLPPRGLMENEPQKTKKRSKRKKDASSVTRILPPKKLKLNTRASRKNKAPERNSEVEIADKRTVHELEQGPPSEPGTSMSSNSLTIENTESMEAGETEGDTPCKYVLSTKGNPMIAHGDYLFRKKSGVGKRSYWICSYDRGFQCKARIRLQEGSDPPKIIGMSGEHNHGREFGGVEAREVVNRMKERALLTDESTDEIYKQCMGDQSYSDEVMVAIASKHAVLAAMRRARRKKDERSVHEAAIRQVLQQVIAENTKSKDGVSDETETDKEQTEQTEIKEEYSAGSEGDVDVVNSEPEEKEGES